MKTSNLRTISFDRDSDRKLQEDFEEVLLRACEGDRRAVDAIDFAFGPSLLEEAHRALGPYCDEADDLLQDFFLPLMDGRSRFIPKHGGAVPWMFRAIRALAQQYVQLEPSDGCAS